MTKILAIKGHTTRGKEVIEIFELLGGKNYYKFNGNHDSSVYYIRNDSSYNNVIDYWEGNYPIDFMIFTLEEFLEKFPYKIGDKVDFIKYDNDEFNVYEIIGMVWTGTTIEYTLDSFGFTCLTKDIRLHKENNMNKNFKSLNVETYLKVWDETENGLEVCVADGYEMIEKDGQFYIVKKQQQYPKTYDECCDILYIETNRIIEYDDCLGYRDITQYDNNLLTQLRYFRKLLICRDAYWKLYGEEMGLGKPWEFKLGSDSKEVVYAISVFGTGIMLDFYYALNCNKILIFPTEEMRDAFYENFKELIEQCKELL